MKPISAGEAWWPGSFGHPSSSGSQNAMRYAFFADKRRFVLDRGGQVTVYDSGDHQITGVSQASHGGVPVVLTSVNTRTSKLLERGDIDVRHGQYEKTTGSRRQGTATIRGVSRFRQGRGHRAAAVKAGVTDEEFAEVTFVAAALRAGGAVTHGTHLLHSRALP